MSSLPIAGDDDGVNTFDNDIGSLQDCPLLPVLDLDPRPTFIVDLNPQEETASIVLFSNKALRSLSKLALEIKTSLQHTQSCFNLIEAISATERDRSAFVRNTIVFGNKSWITYTISKRWRVFSSDLQYSQHDSKTSPEDMTEAGNGYGMPIKHRSSIAISTVAALTHVKPTIPELFCKLTPHNRHVLSHDWSQTSLGVMRAWPTAYQEFLANALSDPEPALLLLGNELLALYNEASKCILEVHDGAFVGEPGRQIADKCWDSQLTQVFDQVMRTGEGVTLRNVSNKRHKQPPFLEELYVTFTITPIFETHNVRVMGLHLSLKDVTQDVFRDRRSETLLQLSTDMMHDSLCAVYRHFIGCLNSRDVPQALLYSTDQIIGSSVCHLQASVSWQPKDSGYNFKQFELNDSHNVLASLFRKSLTEKSPYYLAVEDVHDAIVSGLLGNRGYRDPCKSIAVMPIRLASNHESMGFMLLGLGTRQPFDDNYRTYIVALQRTFAASVEAHQHSDSETELHHRTKIAQEKAELRFTRFSHHTSIGMCIYNPDGSLSFANEQWWLKTGFKRDIDTTSPGWWSPAVHPDDLPLAFAKFSELINNNVPVTFEIRYAHASQYRIPGKDTNLPIWMLVSAYAELSDRQELDFVVACFTEITEQKLLVEAERKHTEDAIEAKRQQESFVDITSHEIRNPLSAVLQCSQEISAILQSYAFSSDDCVKLSTGDIRNVVQAAETIEHCTLHQKGLVDDILTLSKMDSGLLPVSCELAQPDVVAKKTLAFFGREMQQIAIQTDLIIDPSYADLGISWLEFDAGRVSQILINLTTNAIKFTKASTRREVELRIGASKHPSMELWPLTYLPSAVHKIPTVGQDWADESCVYLYFLVSDTGLGMSVEEQNNLFQRFSQGNTKTYTQYGGSGLGLFITRALVEIHGGQIGFKSQSGHGSSFGFYIKTRNLAHNAKVELIHAPLPRGLTAAGTLYDILLVEDNLINQKVLARQLTRHGHRVRIANHGVEALEILKQSRFCVDNGQALSIILMDIEMPIMDGYTCTKTIRGMQASGEIRQHVPILATTGNARDEKVQLALAAGMDDVVLKPFTLDQLLPLLAQLVGSNSSKGKDKNKAHHELKTKLTKDV